MCWDIEAAIKKPVEVFADNIVNKGILYMTIFVLSGRIDK